MHSIYMYEHHCLDMKVMYIIMISQIPGPCLTSIHDARICTNSVHNSLHAMTFDPLKKSALTTLRKDRKLQMPLFTKT